MEVDNELAAVVSTSQAMENAPRQILLEQVPFFF